MKTTLGLVCILSLLLASGTAQAEKLRALSSPHLADYDAELRLPNGRVDVDGMVGKLKELGVTTYYWLIWHAPTDWEDLKLFLPKAAAARIDVWAYLVPPTEGPPQGYPASEPFKLDYLRWAEELARLSREHTNLKAWVIDDFYANHTLFTPAYVGQMQERAKAIQPGFAFLPLMYFNEITPQFAEAYRGVIDGVVVAYPPDREAIAAARAILNDEALSNPGELTCPWNTPTQAGDYASASVSARVVSGKPAVLHFSEEDDFTGPTAGYHLKQLLVDDTVIWEQDAAGGEKGWRKWEADASAATRGKTSVTVTFRVFDKQGVSNFGLRWRLKGLRADGLKLAAPLEQRQQWQVAARGPFQAGFGANVVRREGRFHIPFIVMTAASADEFKLRHGEPASPERIAQWERMCLQSWKDQQCDGVVLYCLDKTAGSKTFGSARELFHEFGKRRMHGE